MSSSQSDLRFLIQTINILLRLVGQDMDLKNLGKSRRILNPVIPLTVVFSTSYALYFLHCVSKMKDLETKSEIVWIVPLMFQYSFLSINRAVYHQDNLDFFAWAVDSFAKTHPQPLIQEQIHINNEKGVKVAKIVFG